MRQIGYRAALTAFAFTALWLFFGIVLLVTPIPGALGISGQMFVAWLMLFFLALGVSGLLLFVAAINGIFPRTVRAPRSAERLWGTSLPPASLPSRPANRRRASGQGR